MDECINTAETIKDLEVTFDAKLKIDKHCDELLSKPPPK